jgi:peptide/nickel transport system permease protein
MDILLERAPRTIVLFLTGQLIAFAVGFSLGKLLAWWRGGVFEYGLTLVGVVLYTIFTPWFGLIMIWVFGFRLKWLPVGKFLDPLLWRTSPVDANYVFGRLLLTALVYTVLVLVVFLATRKLSALWRRIALWSALGLFAAGVVLVWALSDVGVLALDMVRHMVLPLVVYTTVNFAGTMLVMRNTMLETLREDYVMAARAKGLPERVVRDQHAARNAFLPVFTALIIGIPFAISGGIITETVFSWPGMGLTLLSAVQNEDIPMAMGALSFIGVLALLAHRVADIAYSFLDPRIRYK